jgi:hypothetical protein
LSFAAANPTGGLTLVKAQTIGTTVGSVAVTDAFSATYDAYKIVVAGGVASSSDIEFNFNFTGSTTQYYNSFTYTAWNTTVVGVGNSNGSSWLYFGSADTNGLAMSLELVNPFLAKYTSAMTACTRMGIAGPSNGVHKVATSYTGFTLAPSAGTITGGTIYVYGYAKA